MEDILVEMFGKMNNCKMPREKIENLTTINKIKDSNLIGRCITAAERGNIEKEIHEYNTSYHAKNRIGNLEIIFADGVNFQGDGYIIVKSNKETVFTASTSFAQSPTITFTTPPLNMERSFVIEKYHPGDWEKLI